MRKIFLWALTTLVFVYLLLCVGLYFEQSKFIFVPQREVQFTPQEFGCPYQDVHFPAVTRKEKLRGWWLSADPRLSAQMGGRTLIYFHGNGGSIGANAQHACRLRDIGFNVLVFDYRGYGQSDGGPPTEGAVYEDAESAWNYLLHEHNVDGERIVIYGHSLGGAVAIEMAKRHPESPALIAESTFTSIRAMAERNPSFRLFPLSLILNQRMDSLDKIKSIHMPVLLIHGTADDVGRRR